jgi:hypothetical protein
VADQWKSRTGAVTLFKGKKSTTLQKNWFGAGEHDGVHVHTMRAAGMEDLRLSANFLLLNPDKHPDQNISLGVLKHSFFFQGAAISKPP